MATTKHHTKLTVVAFNYGNDFEVVDTSGLMVSANSASVKTASQTPSPQASPTSPQTPTPSGPAKVGDINHDGRIDTVDLSILLARFFTNDPDADLTNDGKVATQDLSMILTRFGT